MMNSMPGPSQQQPIGSSENGEEHLLLGGELVAVPRAMLADEQIFRDVLSPSAFWSLSPASREHLKQFLPPFPHAMASQPPDRQQAALAELLANCAFTADPNFCFGNPLQKFFTRIRNGYFSSPEQVQLRDHRRVLYDHYIRHYQMNLLKKLLVNSHVILEQAATQLSPYEQHARVSTRTFVSERKLAKHKGVKRRARRRAHRMLNDCRTKAGQEAGPSSDDSATEEDLSVAVARPSGTSSASAHQPPALPANARSTLYTARFSPFDLDLHQPADPHRHDVQALYREYAALRETEPDCPSLDISDITLEEVYERAGLSFQAERNFSRMSAAAVLKQKQQQQQQEMAAKNH